MANTADKSEYRGKRALILTRVSTAKQEEKYSHAAQERQVWEKLIVPLGLCIVDEKRHIIHDTYSGLEYRYRKALDDILEIAERGEFDVLCMDVLDRGLGRKALARELFRMQLRELGVRILTTQDSDHADDDSLEGQIMRFFKGYKAEEEVNDFVRRTRDGKREKALGNKDKGIPQQIIGTGDRLYGYKFVLNDKGIRVGYAKNLDVIYVDEDGTEWTEVTVVIFIFESAANGVSTHQLARILNAKGIPTPYNRRVAQNKNLATRNNQTSKESLMRGGFAKCGYCGRSLRVKRVVDTNLSGKEVAYFYYDCDKPYLKGGSKCTGCCIPVDLLDSGITEYIIELIYDPSVVDKRISQLQAANPAHKQQQRKLKNLNTILREQETFRNNLAAEMRKKTLSEKTVAFLNAQLTMLEQQEQEARRDLADQQRMQARIAECNRVEERHQTTLRDPY
jgi:DNA invertase Pin-like site-specific DNA recombinase